MRLLWPRKPHPRRTALNRNHKTLMYLAWLEKIPQFVECRSTLKKDINIAQGPPDKGTTVSAHTRVLSLFVYFGGRGHEGELGRCILPGHVGSYRNFPEVDLRDSV